MSPNEPPPGDPAPAAAAGTPSPSTATSPRLASRGNSIGEAQVVHSPGATAPQPGRARSQSSGQLSGTNSVHATPWIARAALGPLGHIAPQQKSPISPGDYVELTTYRDEESGLIGSDSEATVRPGGSPRGMSSLDDMDLPDGEDPIVYSGGDGEQLLQKSGPEPGSEILELELDGNGTVVSHGEALSSPLRRRRKFSEGFGPWARDLLAQTWDEWTTLDWRLVSQATPSLILATSGLILAGWLLDIVQHWPVFERVTELFILVPIVLNLKGNLEMNLASRLATAANAGILDSRQGIKSVFSGNLLLLQVQAIVVGALAGVVSLSLGAVFHPEFNTWAEDFLLINTSIVTATVTSLLLGALMCVIVVGCRRFDLDPDNIATPIAATLGDLVTLWILAGISHLSLVAIDTPATPIVLFGTLLSLPLWWFLTSRNEHVSGVLRRGWTPIIISMLISSFAGLVLEQYIQRFEGLAVIIPVLNGVVGNLGTIYCARYSSRLHLGQTEDHMKTQTSLFWINLPLQVAFLLSMHFFGLGHTTITPLFAAAYMVLSTLLLVLVLKLGRGLCSVLWKYGLDPDDHALPYLTGICDVVGTAAIVMTFFALFYLGDRDQDVGDRKQ